MLSTGQIIIDNASINEWGSIKEKNLRPLTHYTGKEQERGGYCMFIIHRMLIIYRYISKYLYMI